MADYLGFALVNVMFVLYVYFIFKTLGLVSRAEILEKILRRLETIMNILGDIVDKMKKGVDSKGEPRTEVKKGED